MRIALFEPDIPQNTGNIFRLGACLDLFMIVRLVVPRRGLLPPAWRRGPPSVGAGAAAVVVHVVLVITSTLVGGR